MAAKEYDLIVLGATGYTGTYACENVAKYLPTSLKWAVAGRSAQKLQKVVDDIQSINPDRKPPAVETVQLVYNDLEVLVRKTKILINTVGPYHLYSTPVVEACAKNGIHYLDVTGESPWVKEIIEKFDKSAKASGAIVIPEIGVESVPSDLMAWALAQFLKQKTGEDTLEVVHSLHQIKGQLSGGTLATVFSILDHYPALEVFRATSPSAMAVKPVPSQRESLLTKILGTQYVEKLGQLTPFAAGGCDIPIVYRSWSFLNYGDRFNFSLQMNTRNALTGFLINLVSNILPILFLLKPVRWLLYKLVPHLPGQGPAREDTHSYFAEWRAVGVTDSASPKRAFGRMRFDGDLYNLTGYILAHAAATLLYDDDLVAKRLKGGFLTPATLGQPFVDRLIKDGFKIDLSMIDH